MPHSGPVLPSVAFGPAPGTHPLPRVSTPHERWLRAVALGGQGRYSAARADLVRLERQVPPTSLLASFVASTRASFLRQLGQHRTAAGFDGRALAVVHSLDPRTHRPSDIAAARCDAMTGLAADALGRGRIAQAISLLEHGAVPPAEAYPTADAPISGDTLIRQRIRHSWVTAETALACGDFARARRFADSAAVAAGTFGSTRHIVKSDLLRAAALTGTDTDGAAALAVDVAARASRHGLTPLEWAASMLLVGVGEETYSATRDACAAEIHRRGGRFGILGR